MYITDPWTLQMRAILISKWEREREREESSFVWANNVNLNQCCTLDCQWNRSVLSTALWTRHFLKENQELMNKISKLSTGRSRRIVWWKRIWKSLPHLRGAPKRVYVMCACGALCACVCCWKIGIRIAVYMIVGMMCVCVCAVVSSSVYVFLWIGLNVHAFLWLFLNLCDCVCGCLWS